MNPRIFNMHQFPTSRTLILTLLISVASIFPQPVYAQDESTPRIEGTVTEILATGLIIFKTTEAEEKLILYGIDTFKLKLDQRNVLKKQLADLILGKSAQISVIREIDDMKHVRLFAPDDVAAQLIKKGLVPWDSLLAPDESLYEKAELRAKGGGRGIWASLQTIQHTLGEHTEEQTLDIPREMRAELNARRKSLEFEAALYRWGQLDPADRAHFRDTVMRRAQKGNSRNDERVAYLNRQDSRLRAAQNNNDRNVQMNRDNIASSRVAEQERISEAYNDDALIQDTTQLNNANQRNKDAFWSGYYDYRALDDAVSAERRIEGDIQRIDARAGRISATSQSDRRGYTREMARLENRNSELDQQRVRIRGLGEAATTNLRTQTARNNREVNLINRLDNALENGYTRISKFTKYKTYPYANENDLITISPTFNFIVITWDPLEKNSGIDVFRGSDTAPFTRLFNKTPYYKRFYIFEPGYQYTLKSRVPARIELQYMDPIDMPEPKKQEPADQRSERSLPSNSSTKSEP